MEKGSLSRERQAQLRESKEGKTPFCPSVEFLNNYV